MVRINAILSEDMIEKLDTITKHEHKSRSMLLREAAEQFIEEYQQKMEEVRRKERVKHAIGTQDRLRKKSGAWDGVSELRKWRESAR
jgi:metal-responsive CopG/Arc/MetJ family transcriptional regulator